MTKNRSVLISGGSGFLGSHLTEYYLSNGDSVVVVDNLSTGRIENLSELRKNPNLLFVEADITTTLPDEVTDKSYDIVVNLASPASPPQYQRLGIETMMVGSVGTLQMLDIAKENNARFFHASTSEVYGDPEVHPQTEAYKGSVNCYGPRAMYDEAKRFSEALIYAYHEKYGTSTCMGRFFNTYGPNMDPEDGRVVSNFIVQALRGEPLTVYGEGDQTRSFCYVKDLINGIVKLIDSDVTDPINLGNPSEFTILELAKIIQKLTGTSTKIVYEPLPGDDPMQRKPDISKAKSLLSWEPTVSLEEGLKITLDYFSKELTLQ